MDDGTRITEEVERFLRAARAKNVETCVAMLKENAELVNAVEAGGFGALHFAAFNSDLALIDAMRPFKPDYNLVNYDDNTPLVMAVKGKSHAAIRRLVEHGADVNFAKDHGSTALHYAASVGDIAGMRLLRSLGATFTADPSGTGTILHWATHSGSVDAAGVALYEFGVPINAADEHGGTALFTALFMKKPEVVQFLLEHGADPNVVVAGDKSTPLHIAVEHATLDDVKVLLAFGANPDAANNDGATPKALAAAKGEEGKAVLRELTRERPTAAKRLEDAARFKAQGNKVFGNSESYKAARFYTLAIHNEPANHVFFSNRAACYFAQKNFMLALFDACRCVALAPKWAKGYFRKAASFKALGMIDEATAAVNAGLEVEPANADLLAVRKEIATGK